MNDSTTPPTASRTLTVETPHAGKRLDVFLTATVPEMSRARVRDMLDARQVRLNGRFARKGDPVSAGDTVELLAEPPPRDFPPLPDPSLKLAVRYSDESMLALDKPAGMAAHPLRPDELGTVANHIAAAYPQTAGIGFARREPGLVHRLDTDTSGLLLVALNPAAFEALRASSKDDQISKRYLALVEGTVAAEGRVDHPLVPHRKDPKRVEAVTPNVRLRAGTRTHEAHTWYRPVRELKHGERTFTFLEIEIKTGFRHQIRVHMASVGLPLVGDTLYRGPQPPEGITLERHFLHASELLVPHPVSRAEVRITSPLPDDLAHVIGAMKAS